VKIVTDKVVDASAIGAMVFLEPRALEIERRLDGCELFAPLLLPFEIMSICLKKIRLHPPRRDLILGAFANFRRTAINLQDVNEESVLELGEQHRLSAYDASYLWLSRQLGVELVTLDMRLAKAAAKTH
jgi:predicted nucleic acid-binding protein